ncbi:TetR/AcrR family transcriptional regulator [Geodermatophilus sp. SYSU D00710]
MATTRDRALDAAVELLGTEGLRALTHTRVDARAGLPKGSTSNHFRTRRALLSGVMDHLVALQLQEVRGAFEAVTADDLVDRLCDLLEHATGPGRAVTAARYALFVEAGHDPDLREPLARGRASVEAPLVLALAGLGVRDPRAATAVLVPCLQGLLLRRISRLDDADPRPVVSRVVQAVLD